MTLRERLAAALPSPLERRIALRYLRGRRTRRGASLNTAISIGGVTVGVMALIVVLGVMNGLRNDLRDRILHASPHLRILTYGAGLRVDDWRTVLQAVRKDPDVVAAAPEVISQTVITKGADYAEAVNVLGFDPDTGTRAVTSLPASITKGDLTFHTTSDSVDGAVMLGERLAARINAYPGDVITLIPPTFPRNEHDLSRPVYVPVMPPFSDMRPVKWISPVAPPLQL